MAETNVLNLFQLDGKVALITGASGYLGGAMARALAEAGASVVVSSRDENTAQTIAAQLPSSSGNTHWGVQLDHMDDSSLASGFQHAVALAGQVDILVNNGHEAVADDLTTISGKQFRRQLDNLAGYFLLSREFRDHVVGRGGQGSLILIGSMYGQVGSYPDVYAGMGPANSVAYQALKGGIGQLTRHLAVYWAGDGIRVNCLSPGPFPSEKTSPGLVARIAEKSPMKRIGTASELKGAVVFLASEAASYITGHNLRVDGGWTAW